MKTLSPEVLDRLKDFKFEYSGSSSDRDIISLLERTVLLGGKRLRPLLTYIMGSLFESNLKQLDTYAKAIELVHAASLSHDDVIDGATGRRGLPSINIVGSNKRAVLAGDYLLSQVIVDLADAGNLELVKEMSMVIHDLSVGEWLQLDASENKEYSQEIIEEIASKKTASVMSWCCVAPAILSGLSPQLIEYAREFGKNLGLAFQLMDDTLDFSGNGQKDHMLDIQNGIVNSVIFEWLEMNPSIKNKFENGDEISHLFDGSNIELAVSKTRDRATLKLNKSKELLEILRAELNIPKESLESINHIINYLSQRQN